MYVKSETSMDGDFGLAVIDAMYSSYISGSAVPCGSLLFLGTLAL